MNVKGNRREVLRQAQTFLSTTCTADLRSEEVGAAMALGFRRFHQRGSSLLELAVVMGVTAILGGISTSCLDLEAPS